MSNEGTRFVFIVAVEGDDLEKVRNDFEEKINNWTEDAELRTISVQTTVTDERANNGLLVMTATLVMTSQDEGGGA